MNCVFVRHRSTSLFVLGILATLLGLRFQYSEGRLRSSLGGRRLLRRAMQKTERNNSGHMVA